MNIETAAKAASNDPTDDEKIAKSVLENSQSKDANAELKESQENDDVIMNDAEEKKESQKEAQAADNVEE